MRSGSRQDRDVNTRSFEVIMILGLLIRVYSGYAHAMSLIETLPRGKCQAVKQTLRTQMKDRLKELLTRKAGPSQTSFMAKSSSTRPSNNPAGSRPRPELRKGGKPVGVEQPPAVKFHLMDFLTVPRAIAALTIFLVVVGSAFYFPSSSRMARLGVEARNEMAKGHWEKSLAAWQALYDMGDDQQISPIVNMSMGRCLLELKKWEPALDHLDKALANADQLAGSPNALVGLHAMRGWALVEMGKIEEGFTELKTELQSNPDQPLANLVVGRFFLKNNDPVRAGLHFQRLANRPEYAKEVADFKKYVAENFLNIPDSELTDVPEKISSLPRGARAIG